jgi:hypothetical protein
MSRDLIKVGYAQFTAAPTLMADSNNKHSDHRVAYGFTAAHIVLQRAKRTNFEQTAAFADVGINYRTTRRLYVDGSFLCPHLLIDQAGRVGRGSLFADPTRPAPWVDPTRVQLCKLG